MNALSQVRLEAGRFLEVGAHILDTDTLRLVTSPEVKLPPKAVAVLVRLAYAGGRTLGRDELLDDVWRGTCPTPDVLTQAIKDLRRALGDDPQAPQYIETVPRLGYRLVAAARFLDAWPLPSAPAAAVAPPPADPAARTRFDATAMLLCTVALVLAVAALVRTFVPPPPPKVLRWQVDEQRSLTSEPGPESFPRISPDGSRIAYSIGDPATHSTRIVQKALDASGAVRLSASEDGNEYYPVWSPDGRAVAFMRFSGEHCRLVVVPPLGGSERVVDDECYAGLVNPFAWTPDGKGLVSTAPSQDGVDDMSIVSWPIDGGHGQRLEYSHALNDTDLDARYSPDGRWIAFRRGANPNSDLFLVSAAGGEVRQLTRLATRIRGYDWVRDGSALVFSSGQGGQQALYVVDIADGRIDALGVQPAEFPSAARATDTVVYEIPRVRQQLSRIDVDAPASAVDLVPSTGSDGAPAASPVNDDVVFVSDRSGSQELWILPRGAREAHALTALPEPTLLHPTWRADGTRVLVTARGPFGGRLIEVEVASRIVHALTDVADEDVRSGTYGRGEGTFVAVVNARERRSELIEFDSVGGREANRRVLAQDVGRADFDPDSGVIHFTRITAPGLFRLDPASGEETEVTRELSPSHLDGWRVHGGELYYFALEAAGPSELMARPLAGGEPRTVLSLPTQIADLAFSVGHDGRSIYVARVVSEDTDVGAVRLRRDAID
ncbi:winged helix-turn-helix domain-containing protein [Dokdonella fugitiva]|uniref:winged helix-turn-helix domain-containing protein n=1 Tax=Dokdonella fugitiva TaxID=328517 RepID=UPI0015FBADB7|nr:winged helix-turn-helix domain-containing protein [Dokdonella fugitiva]MBA8885482.1 Tol biopolymer transport system component/DNA-binding winged helix-turn-helix (wHTH) protein [Dokdonella fugitiva]